MIEMCCCTHLALCYDFITFLEWLEEVKIFLALFLHAFRGVFWLWFYFLLNDTGLMDNTGLWGALVTLQQNYDSLAQRFNVWLLDKYLLQLSFLTNYIFYWMTLVDDKGLWWALVISQKHHDSGSQRFNALNSRTNVFCNCFLAKQIFYWMTQA